MVSGHDRRIATHRTTGCGRPAGAVDGRPGSRRPRRGRHPSRAVARKHGLPGTGYPRAWEASSATSMTAVASRRGAADTRAAEHGAGRGPLWSTPRISGTSAPRPDQPAPSAIIAGRRRPGRGGSTAKVRPDAPRPGPHRHAHRGRQDGARRNHNHRVRRQPARTRRWRRPARRRRLDRREPRQNVSAPTGTSTRHFNSSAVAQLRRGEAGSPCGARRGDPPGRPPRMVGVRGGAPRSSDRVVFHRGRLARRCRPKVASRPGPARFGPP